MGRIVITAKEREESFRRDLSELLEVTDNGAGYGMQIGIAVITMMSEWDNDNNLIAEYVEFLI